MKGIKWEHPTTPSAIAVKQPTYGISQNSVLLNQDTELSQSWRKAEGRGTLYWSTIPTSVFDLFVFPVLNNA